MKITSVLARAEASPNPPATTNLGVGKVRINLRRTTTKEEEVTWCPHPHSCTSHIHVPICQWSMLVALWLLPKINVHTFLSKDCFAKTFLELIISYLPVGSEVGNLCDQFGGLWKVSTGQDDHVLADLDGAVPWPAWWWQRDAGDALVSSPWQKLWCLRRIVSTNEENALVGHTGWVEPSAVQCARHPFFPTKIGGKQITRVHIAGDRAEVRWCKVHQDSINILIVVRKLWQLGTLHHLGHMEDYQWCAPTSLGEGWGNELTFLNSRWIPLLDFPRQTLLFLESKTPPTAIFRFSLPPPIRILFHLNGCHCCRRRSQIQGEP